MNIKPSLSLLLLFCILFPALAQDKPASPPPPRQSGEQDDVVKINTNLVQVDVVVTKDGKLVTDLTADDFEVYQDGRRQTITSFAYISNVPGSASQPAPNTAKKKKDDVVVPFTPVKATDPRRIMAFVVDDLGIAWENLSLVKRQLRKFINEQMEPHDLVAIVRTGGELGVLQQFTNDKRMLLRAVERLRWNPCNRVGHYTFAPVGTSEHTASICGERSYDLSLKALGFIVDSMGYLPGRKSLVLLSDSMPAETQEFGGPLSTGMAQNERLTVGPTSTSVTDVLQRVAERAIRSSVVIYSVDTMGLVYTGPTAADPFPLGTRQVWAGGAQGAAERGPQQTTRVMDARSDTLWFRRLGGDLIAKQTGGFQIRNSNSYDFDRILRDQAGYYLLGYRPSEETFNRRFHHIKAKVKRSGMTLRTRFGFAGVTEEEAKRAKPTPRDVTNLALASPFAAQDIEVDLTSFFADDKQSGPVVRSFVYIDPKDLTFTRVDGRYHASLELYGMIFGDNGVIVEERADAATFNFSDADYEQITRDGIGIGFDMPAKRPGAYQVRVAARDKASSKIGTAGQYMAVPDLKKKQQLAVSGIVLGTVNADKTVGRSGIRRFLAGSDLYYAYNLYNAIDEQGTPRDLVMDVMLFRDGKIVQTVPEVPIVATDPSDRSRVFVGNTLRLDPALEPGHYHLQVLVRNRNVKQKGPAVAQWADFGIEKN
ncbi:MAG TPA: VWA domain-containing protein [Pyrinomonadaceae bacterium]